MRIFIGVLEKQQQQKRQEQIELDQLKALFNGGSGVNDERDKPEGSVDIGGGKEIMLNNSALIR